MVCSIVVVVVVFVIYYVDSIQADKQINSNLNGSCCLDEVFSIVVVFLHSSGHCENVWIKDDVIGVEINFGHKQVVRTCADFNLVF